MSSIMEEKLISPYISTGTISMQGGFKSRVSEEEDDDDVNLSAPLADVKDGKIKVLLGHPESWTSKTGKDILDNLQEKGLILFTFLDEGPR